jgi:hypothetical protein
MDYSLGSFMCVVDEGRRTSSCGRYEVEPPHSSLSFPCRGIFAEAEAAIGIFAAIGGLSEAFRYVLDFGAAKMIA